MGNGKIWTEQRRFALRTLRDLGFGKTVMNNIISDEVDQFVDFLSQKTEEDLNLAEQICLPVVNTIWRLVSSERLSYGDAIHLNVVKRIVDIFKYTASGKFLASIAFPKMTRNRFMRNVMGVKDYKDNITTVKNFMKQSVEKHLKTLVEDPE